MKRFFEVVYLSYLILRWTLKVVVRCKSRDGSLKAESLESEVKRILNIIQHLCSNRKGGQ